MEYEVKERGRLLFFIQPIQAFEIYCNGVMVYVASSRKMAQKFIIDRLIKKCHER